MNPGVAREPPADSPTPRPGPVPDWVMVDGHAGPADDARLPLDPFLLRGDGCFETALVASEVEGPPDSAETAQSGMRGQGARVIAMSRHLSRLCSSLLTLRLFETTAALESMLRDEIARLLAAAPTTDAERLLRITVTPTLRLLELRRLPDRVHLRRRGVALHPLLEPRSDGLTTRHKTLAWSTHAAAIRQHPRANDPTFEGVWLAGAISSPEPRAGQGLVLEGTATNIFAVLGNDVVTTPTTRPILAGTARARALEAFIALGLTVSERDLTESELVAADAVFATSALLLAAPALSYRDTPLRQASDELLRDVVALMRR